MKQLAGFLMILLGTLLGSWTAYNLFVDRLTATQDANPIPGILLTIGLFYVGQKWIREAREREDHSLTMASEREKQDRVDCG
jgi:hypothetical protein